MLELRRIRLDGGTQARVETNKAVVAEYAEAMQNGATFPPVTVFYDGSDYWLADGFTRYEAAQSIGMEKIVEEVIPGTRRDAVLHSLGANAKHGLRRTNADKHKAVETLLADDEWSKWSDREIARACGVSAPFVGSLRRPEVKEKQQANRADSAAKALSDGCNPITPPHYKHDAEAAMETANIGKKPGSDPAGDPSPATPASLSPEGLETDPQPAAPEPDTAVDDDSCDYALTDEEMALLEEEQKADLRRMELILDSDDALAAVTEENKKLTAQLAQLQLRLNGLLNEKAAAIDQARKEQRKADRMSKELERLKKWAAENNLGVPA